MSDFKEFLDAVEAGEPRHDLFLYPNRALRERAVVDLFNEAGKRGLCPIVRSAQKQVIVGTSVAAVRIVHEYIHRELRSVFLTAVNGLEALDKYPDIEPVKNELRALVR